jgi:hypothetical protein
MSWGFDDINCGGRLQVGTGIVPAIKEGDEKINGSMHAEGPAVFGGPTEFPDNFATLMVGRTKNDDKDCVPAKRSLYVKGNTVIEGDDGTSSTLNITSSAGQAININDGTVWINDEGEAMFKTGTSGKTLSARFVEADSKPKPFDIQHPSKGEGWRLRYACIEGPEVAVYHRGRLRRGKEIVLPRYWKDLVHINSITVQLQPIGSHQDIIIKRWDDEKIYLQSMGGMPIDCFYHVYAERKDINPLIIEYAGKDCFDYPDPNYKPGVVNPRYDDPDFAGPPNTITM